MTAYLFGIPPLKQESNWNRLGEKKQREREKGVGIDENERFIGGRSPLMQDLARRQWNNNTIL